MPTLEEIKARSHVVWSSGDYSKIAWITTPLADRLVEAAKIRPGATVLDVATGTGHVALAAARRFGQTTGLDFVPSLIETAQRRAAVEDLDVEFVVGDAEALQFGDGSFEFVFSAIGAMFAPNQQAVADELVRVCAPGGTIGMVNWTPTGFIGELFKTVAKHVPPPAEIKPAALWGNEDHVRGLFGDGVAKLDFQPGNLTQYYRSPEHFADFFLTHYGPTLKASESLGEDAKRTAFRSDLVDLAERFNSVADGTAALQADYVIVLAAKP